MLLFLSRSFPSSLFPSSSGSSCRPPSAPPLSLPSPEPGSLLSPRETLFPPIHRPYTFPRQSYPPPPLPTARLSGPTARPATHPCSLAVGEMPHRNAPSRCPSPTSLGAAGRAGRGPLPRGPRISGAAHCPWGGAQHSGEGGCPCGPRLCRKSGRAPRWQGLCQRAPEGSKPAARSIATTGRSQQKDHSPLAGEQNAPPVPLSSSTLGPSRLLSSFLPDRPSALPVRYLVPRPFHAMVLCRS